MVNYGELPGRGAHSCEGEKTALAAYLLTALELPPDGGIIGTFFHPQLVEATGLMPDGGIIGMT
jgi:hypothetical protein